MDLKLVSPVLKLMLYTRWKGKKLCLQKSYRNNKLVRNSLWWPIYITNSVDKDQLIQKIYYNGKKRVLFRRYGSSLHFSETSWSWVILSNLSVRYVAELTHSSVPIVWSSDFPRKWNWICFRLLRCFWTVIKFWYLSESDSYKIPFPVICKKACCLD